MIKEDDALFTILATCYGKNALDELDNAYGFSGEVDYQVASLISSALIF